MASTASSSSPRHRTLRTVGALATSVAIVAALGGGAVASAAPTKGKLRLIKVLHPTSRFEGFKASSSRIAKSDRALLHSTSARTTRVVVKLDYDALSRYGGDLAGFAATSPSVTGQPRATERRSSRVGG